MDNVENEILTVEEVLEKVNQSFPFNKEKYIAYKCYSLLIKMLNNPDDEEASLMIEDYINRQLKKVEVNFEKYEEMEVSSEIIDTHNDILKALEFYYEGLNILGDFLETENPNDLSLAFEYIIDADELFIKIEKLSEQYATDNPITLIF